MQQLSKAIAQISEIVKVTELTTGNVVLPEPRMITLDQQEIQPGRYIQGRIEFLIPIADQL